MASKGPVARLSAAWQRMSPRGKIATAILLALTLFVIAGALVYVSAPPPVTTAPITR